MIEVLLNPGFELKIDAHALKGLIDRTAFAMGKQDSLPFNGLLVEVSRHRIRAVATDGHRLAMSEISVNCDLASGQNMILAREDLYELRARLEPIDTDVSVAIRDNNLRVEWPDQSFDVALIFGNYPNYRAVMPDHPCSVVVDRMSLLSSIEQSTVAGAKPQLRFAVRDRSLMIADVDGTRRNALDVDYAGEDVAVVFTTKYLSGVLDAISGDRVRASFSVKHPAWRFESVNDPTSAYMIMSAREAARRTQDADQSCGRAHAMN
jgi:DNA polymerase-3 subunit beta